MKAAKRWARVTGAEKKLTMQGSRKRKPAPDETLQAVATQKASDKGMAKKFGIAGE